MSETIEFTGAARLDHFKALWPLAKLTVSREKLVLEVIRAGAYTFTPENVSKIEKYLLIPLVGSGIRIRHLVPDYPKSVIFLYLGLPSTVLRAVQDSGFLGVAEQAAVG